MRELALAISISAVLVVLLFRKFRYHWSCQALSERRLAKLQEEVLLRINPSSVPFYFAPRPFRKLSDAVLHEMIYREVDRLDQEIASIRAHIRRAKSDACYLRQR